MMIIIMIIMIVIITTTTTTTTITVTIICWLIPAAMSSLLLFECAVTLVVKLETASF